MGSTNADEDGKTGDGVVGEFWVDHFFPKWEDEIANDAVVISCDISDNLLSHASTQKMLKLHTK